MNVSVWSDIMEQNVIMVFAYYKDNFKDTGHTTMFIFVKDGISIHIKGILGNKPFRC